MTLSWLELKPKNSGSLWNGWTWKLNVSHMGRPSDYSLETATDICERLAKGESLRTVCKDDDMPSQTSVFRWLGVNESFREQYARAREAQADFYADEIITISDDGSNDWMERRSEAEKGAGVDTGWVLNGEHVQRSRLRVDARKWYASKVAPKKYGDKLMNEHSGPDGGPIATTTEVRVTIIDPKS